VEEVVDGIRRCSLVATTSLHGLVVAHAYGIPAVWVEFKPLPSGDRTKFLDYLESVGRFGASPLVVDPAELQPELLWRNAVEPPTSGDIDLDALWDACPFRPDR